MWGAILTGVALEGEVKAGCVGNKLEWVELDVF